MNRRQFLATVGTGGLLAGCLSAVSGDGGSPAEEAGADATPTGTERADRDTPTPTATPDTDPEVDPGDTRLAAHGVPADICETSIRADPSIYAITDPVFAADWSGHEITPAYRHENDLAALVDEQTVIGLEADGLARAYPLTVLDTHEVVNDTVGEPVIVTFCPLCSSGMVASRRVDGEATRFAVTGQLWIPERVFERASEEEGRTFGAAYSGGEVVPVRHNGNLVMYDAATRSYWSQILARGICGPHTGTELEIRPSTVATWGEWRADHPDTGVLLPPPHSETVEPGVILGADENG